MIFLGDCYGISIGFPWWFFGISKRFHKDVYRIPVGFLFDFHEISMAFLWYSCGISLVVLKEFHDISVGFLYDISMGFLPDSNP